jgi:hypothetical protein
MGSAFEKKSYGNKYRTEEMGGRRHKGLLDNFMEERKY